MGKRCGNCANSTWLGGMDAVPEICLKCEYVHGEPSNWKEKTMTNADRIRRTDDVELMNRIYELHVLLSEFGHYELAEQFCDCKAECHDGEDCNEDRLKACILRWLQRPAEEDAK